MGVVIHKADSKLPRTDADSDLLRSVEVTRVLELYPEYYKQFQEASHCLMAGDGSLPRQSRHYVAFLAIRWVLCTVHCALCTLYCALCTLYCALYSVHLNIIDMICTGTLAVTL